MRLLFATTNEKKVVSVARVLSTYGITVERRSLDLVEPQGRTAAEVSRAKVLQAFQITSEPVMVMDGALFIAALDGFPGPYVKDVTAQIGTEGYMRLLSHLPMARDRTARFDDAISYMDERSAHAPVTFVRSEHGTVPLYASGNNVRKSLVERIFVPEGYSKTLADMDDAEFTAYRTNPRVESFYHTFARTLISRASTS